MTTKTATADLKPWTLDSFPGHATLYIEAPPGDLSVSVGFNGVTSLSASPEVFAAIRDALNAEAEA